MALLLSAILCVQLLPAMVRAEEGTAAASEGKGAFGLPAATGLTEDSTEYNSAVADAPLRQQRPRRAAVCQVGADAVLQLGRSTAVQPHL